MEVKSQPVKSTKRSASDRVSDAATFRDKFSTKEIK